MTNSHEDHLGSSILTAESLAHTERVKRIATALMAGMIERGEVELSDEAIRAAMPGVVRDARAVVTAAEEFVCG
jgi:hypothetical protein